MARLAILGFMFLCITLTVGCGKSSTVNPPPTGPTPPFNVPMPIISGHPPTFEALPEQGLALGLALNPGAMGTKDWVPPKPCAAPGQQLQPLASLLIKNSTDNKVNSTDLHYVEVNTAEAMDNLLHIDVNVEAKYAFASGSASYSKTHQFSTSSNTYRLAMEAENDYPWIRIAQPVLSKDDHKLLDSGDRNDYITFVNKYGPEYISGQHNMATVAFIITVTSTSADEMDKSEKAAHLAASYLSGSASANGDMSQTAKDAVSSSQVHIDFFATGGPGLGDETTAGNASDDKKHRKPLSELLTSSNIDDMKATVASYMDQLKTSNGAPVEYESTPFVSRYKPTVSDTMRDDELREAYDDYERCHDNIAMLTDIKQNQKLPEYNYLTSIQLKSYSDQLDAYHKYESYIRDIAAKIMAGKDVVKDDQYIDPGPVNIPMPIGASATLKNAITYGDLAVVKDLMTRCPDLATKDLDPGTKLIHYAAEKDVKGDITKYLLSLPLMQTFNQVNAKNVFGDTPFQIALAKNMTGPLDALTRSQYLDRTHLGDVIKTLQNNTDVELPREDKYYIADKILHDNLNPK